MVCKAQTIPINKIKNDAWPNIVNKKSETFAPRGPPKLFIFKEDVLLKNAGSEESYETNAINMYKENNFNEMKNLVYCEGSKLNE